MSTQFKEKLLKSDNDTEWRAGKLLEEAFETEMELRSQIYYWKLIAAELVEFDLVEQYTINSRDPKDIYEIIQRIKGLKLAAENEKIDP